MPSPSQDAAAASSIPVVHAADGSGYRLLELPPDLMAETSHPWHLDCDDMGLARLRTAQGRVFSMRQKNTSNSLVLLSSVPLPAREDEDAGLPKTGLAAVATLHETIELIEESSPLKSAPPPGASSATPSQPAPPPSRGKWHEKFGRTR